ncbi:MAG: MFS transporter [Planctomycetota bacterium]|jgi:MFS family permease
MLWRFSLYGFLKNQKYYEPFLILAFLEKGLSFFTIGLLIGFRQICINLFEIPSGAVADLYGRRRCMILSFVSYVVSFVLFALARQLLWLFAAMLFFAVGEAFRTGTHKAMIFDWLAHQGREDQKTKIYGYTRSWSQIGSALSVIIAAGVVLLSASYNWIFWMSCLPYLLGIVNFIQYPAYLDGKVDSQLSLRTVYRHVFQTLRSCIGIRPLRGLLSESMLLTGGYTTIKDYLQPLLKYTALALPVFVALDDEQRSALLVGLVYSILYLLSAFSSRMADRLSRIQGGEDKTCKLLILVHGLLFMLLLPSLYYGYHLIAILAFVGLAMLQNIWRPVFLARMDQNTDNAMGATILSAESQAKSLFTMITAPILGLAVDHWGLWSVGSFGLLVVGILFVTTAGSSRNLKLEN